MGEQPHKPPTWEEMRDGTRTVDGIAGVPWLIEWVLGGPPLEPWRVWRYGKVLGCGKVEFPAPYGERTVVFFEGGAVAWYPEETPGKMVQKVHWADLPRIAKALGIA